MQKTSNYNLNKPDYSDVVDIAMLNENADIIDTELIKKLNKTDLPRNVIYCGLTTSNAVAYTAKANPTLTKYEDGVIYIIIPHITCSDNPTLNIDGRGATYLKNSDGDNLMAGDMKANIPYQFVRVGSSFFMCSGKKSDSFGKLHSKNPWKYFGANMPTEKASFGCVQVNGKIYCIGGINFNTYTHTLNRLEIYDIETDKWSLGTTLPRYVACPMVCTYNNKIYVFGGFRNYSSLWPSEYTGEVNIYDIATNTWTTLPSGMPFALARACCEVDENGKVYILGGQAKSYTIAAANLVYDIPTNTWSYCEPSPTKRTASCSVINNNKIYLIGGLEIQLNAVPDDITQPDRAYDAYTEVYDIATSTWTTIPSGIGTNLDGCVEIYNGNMYIFGGQGKITRCSASYIIDPLLFETTDVGSHMAEILDLINISDYKIIPPPPTLRTAGASCIYKDKIFFVGGVSSYTERNQDVIDDSNIGYSKLHKSVEILDCNYDK